MIRTLERYGEKKGLEVNVKKTKVMRCRKGGGRRKKVTWIRDLRMEGQGKDGETRGKVLKMGSGGVKESSRISGEGRAAKGFTGR
ncbi:GSCOCG00012086001-RA-CDS [Cotesia congregata]|nr:GSCOCG00012086001-RA-CDS [Cotesia congregata]